MFKYTREAINKIIDDFKLFSKIFKYTSQVITVAYLTYSIIAHVGNFYANIILLFLFLSYTIFDFIVSDEENKFFKKVVKRTINWIIEVIKV